MAGELARVQVAPGYSAFDWTGLTFSTGAGTYNPGQHEPGEETHFLPVAKFWLIGDMGQHYYARVALTVRGNFETYGAERPDPTMVNCYLYLLESEGLSDEVHFSIDARPLEQAVGTPEDPLIRFFCTWEIRLYFPMWISDVDPTDCRGTLTIDVNRWGGTSYVDHSITYGQARVTTGSGFLLEHWTDKWIVGP
jgi:hypothetical protein